MFQQLPYIVLASVVFATGCAATQDKFCRLVDNDSYLLISIARCETLEVSFDYDTRAGFAKLETYNWLPAQTSSSVESGSNDDERLQAWVTDAVDAQLVQKGFRQDGNAPDFLVSYDTPGGMQGSLTLVFVSPDSQQLIWRGKADDTGYPARNADALEIRIRTAVGMLLEQFPPLHYIIPEK